MSNPITVGLSGLTNRIFAGRSKPSKLAPGVREFTGEKFDVTDDVLFAVAHLMIARDDVLVSLRQTARKSTFALTSKTRQVQHEQSLSR